MQHWNVITAGFFIGAYPNVDVSLWQEEFKANIIKLTKIKKPIFAFIIKIIYDRTKSLPSTSYACLFSSTPTQPTKQKAIHIDVQAAQSSIIVSAIHSILKSSTFYHLYNNKVSFSLQFDFSKNATK